MTGCVCGLDEKKVLVLSANMRSMTLLLLSLYLSIYLSYPQSRNGKVLLESESE